MAVISLADHCRERSRPLFEISEDPNGPTPEELYMLRQSIQRDARFYRPTVSSLQRQLSRIAAQLAGGVYVRGPRRGQPLNPEVREAKEQRAEAARRRLEEIDEQGRRSVDDVIAGIGTHE